jgi:hypothetical protein
MSYRWLVVVLAVPPACNIPVVAFTPAVPDDSPACGLNGECPDDGLPETWTFDSASDFAAPGHAVQDMTIEARGSLTPNAYTYGGLIAHGLQDNVLWSHDDTAWTKLDGLVPTGTGFWRGESLAPTDALNYLGITNSGSMTIWFEGEVWLDAGSTEMFKLVGDDVAFFQIALPGTSSYGAASDNNTSAVAVQTSISGWYPIRIGTSNGVNFSNFTFTHSDAGGPQIPWTRDRLRARTSELTGTLRTVFPARLLNGSSPLPSIPQFEERDLLSLTVFPNPLPQGVPPSGDDWSARYLGQVYVAQPGPYSLTIVSDDANRGRLGTTNGDASWYDDGSNANATSMIPATLVAGWNDLVVDYNQHGGDHRLQVQIQGPDFPSLGAVPRDRLRPVELVDDRFTIGADITGYLVQDGGGSAMPAVATMAAGGYAGETVTSIDLTYEIDSPRWNELKIDLETPSTSGGPGTRLTIRNQDGAGGNGAHTGKLTVPAGMTIGPGVLLGGPAGGDWKLYVYDVVNGGNSSFLKSAKIMLHTSGGPAKIAPTALWTSPVLTLATEVFAIDGITADARLPDGASIAVQARGCQQADCSDGTWASPAELSTPFAVGPGHYLQLRINMTSNAVLEPELRSLKVNYRRAL